MFGSRNIASQPTPGDPNATPAIRYLYWGLTGARFGRHTKPATQKNDPQQQNKPATMAWASWDDAPELLVHPQEPEPPRNMPGSASRIEETIARLTAERDAARYECELAADYREALARTVDMLRKQFEEAQQRLLARDPEQSNGRNGTPSAREVDLETQLIEALRRIDELEARAAATDNPQNRQKPAALVPRDDMMDIFLQFVGSRDRPDNTRL